MWAKFMTYRNENNIDSILQNFDKHPKWEQALECYSRGWYGVDKIGRPIYVDRIGAIKVDKLLEAVGEEWIARSFYYVYEYMMKVRFLSCSAVFDRQIHMAVNVFDLSGFGMHLWNRQTMRLLKSVLQIGTDFYPESMGKIVICNAPWYFTSVFAVIKTWLDERTRRKITVSSSGHLKILQDLVDDDQIPTFLGG